MQHIAITFDVDMVNYAGHHSNIDEIENCFSDIQEVLIDFPQVKTTWFIRIDSQIELLYGRADFVFHRHVDVVDWLLENGHQIGWHHHAYRFRNGNWSQETRTEIATSEVKRFGKFARELGISTSRMGWGWHTNDSMQVLDELGFRIDSSCMPRPVYPWEINSKDWSRAPSWPYRPSRSDYQIPGEPSLQLLEIPISTTYIPAPQDSLTMKRYLNLAYRPEVFTCALGTLKNQSLLVTITHPYELLDNSTIHPLIAFDLTALRMNLTQLTTLNVEFITLEEIARYYTPSST